MTEVQPWGSRLMAFTEHTRFDPERVVYAVRRYKIIRNPGGDTYVQTRLSLTVSSGHTLDANWFDVLPDTRLYFFATTDPEAPTVEEVQEAESKMETL